MFHYETVFSMFFWSFDAYDFAIWVWCLDMFPTCFPLKFLRFRPDAHETFIPSFPVLRAVTSGRGVAGEYVDSKGWPGKVGTEHGWHQLVNSCKGRASGILYTYIYMLYIWYQICMQKKCFYKQVFICFHLFFHMCDLPFPWSIFCIVYCFCFCMQKDMRSIQPLRSCKEIWRHYSRFMMMCFFGFAEKRTKACKTIGDP